MNKNNKNDSTKNENDEFSNQHAVNKDQLDNDDLKNSQNKKLSKLESLTKGFRTRAENKRRISYYCLALIIFLIFVGISLFLYAGQLVTNESKIEENLINSRRKEIDENIEKVNREIKNEITDMQKEYEDKQKNNLIINKTSEKEFKEKIDKLKKIKTDNWEISIKEKDVLVSSLKKLKDRENQKQPLQLQRAELFQLISTVVTRFGVVILLLFLVKILVPLYKYNTKLSAFYDARADAVELFTIKNEEINEDSLEIIMRILSPDGVDWGNSPNTPTDKTIDLAKSIVDRTK